MRIRILLALAFTAATVLTNVAAAENIAYGVGVVVIDPGHGGRLPGAHYGNVYEKEIVLKVALRLGRFIEEGMPGVKVVYTRTKDEMLGTDLAADLQKRADIANRAGGELFISIHANAAPARSAHGIEVLVMGETPKEQQYNTNALYENNREDLIDLATEPNAPIVRARIQNMQFTYGEYSMAAARCIERNFRKAGRDVRRIKPQLLRVLYATDMPGVLTEIGFMSNAEELAFMKSEKGQTQIARSLYEAVRDYSDYVLNIRRGDADSATHDPAAQTAASGASDNKPATPNAASGVSGKPAASAAGTARSVKPAAAGACDEAPLRYTVQVLSSEKSLSSDSREFRSYRGKVKRYRGADGLFKYCVGEYDSRGAAQRQASKIRKVFPGAFVVSCRGTEIVK